MNKIYEQQLLLNKTKIEEGTRSKYRGNRKNKVETPKEPPSQLAAYTGADLAWDVAGTVDPTGVVDIVNAGRYAAKGDLKGAAISLAGVIPYVGDTLKAGRATKGAMKAAEVLTPAIRKPRLSADDARKLVADRLSKNTTKTTQKTSELVATQTSGGRLVSTATAAAGGAVVGAAIPAAIKRAAQEYLDPETESKKKEKQILEPQKDIGIDIRKLSAFEPGEASGYTRSMSSRKGQDDLHAGYHPYFTAPLNTELNRRRSYHAQSKALPESMEADMMIKNKIKQSLNNYLSSKQGKKLSDHLETVRKTIAFN
jgi:hypothetical protein